MGADMDTAWAPNIDKPRNGFDVTLHTTSVEEARRWFEQLAVGGRVVTPFSEIFWSPGYGSLVDRFGVPWMINTSPGPGWKPPQA
jgi:PhnB protein